MSAIPDILTKIVRHKEREIASRSGAASVAELKTRVEHAAPPRDFAGALQQSAANQQPGIIAEIKKASPSQGVIREHFDPAAIAKSYAGAGVSCLSVLTDEHFFQGADEYLRQARQACDKPVLRKDFVVDAYQVWESRAIGADCILLIAAVLNDAQLAEFSELACTLQMSVLVEVHDEPELTRALGLGLPLIGINNRNLRSFQTTLQTTLDLLPLVPSDRMVITESGIHHAGDVSMLRQHGVNGFLIGEACMRVNDPGQKIRELFFDPMSAQVAS